MHFPNHLTKQEICFLQFLTTRLRASGQQLALSIKVNDIEKAIFGTQTRNTDDTHKEIIIFLLDMSRKTLTISNQNKEKSLLSLFSSFSMPKDTSLIGNEIYFARDRFLQNTLFKKE